MTKTFSDLFLHPGHLIRRAHQIHMSLFDDEFAVYDISPVQYVILKVLEEYEEMDLTTAAGIAAVDKPSCTRFVGRLAVRGLVSTSSDASDQRRKRLRLTAKGRKLIPRLDQSARVLEERMMERLPAARREQFLDIMAEFAALNNDLSRAPHQPPAIGATAPALDDA